MNNNAATKKTPIRTGRNGAGGHVNTSSLDRSLGYSLRRAQMSTYLEFSRFMGEFDVRPSQFCVLVLVRHNPGLTQASVSKALDIQKTNLVPLLDGLEKRGLLERRAVEGDRRSSALHLTTRGEAEVREMEAGHDLMEEEMRHRLGVQDSRHLLQLLHAFQTLQSRDEPELP